ncbi:manganese efflux pump MntP [Agilicoccus flavus]|uniref:manganese efflux pump MntP n=1 Tax=Agilicoccus flavus TaxID=2775968 RepID=UPI001CF6811C|nr:manganese efflux pump MntP family protein [Agilicoccus flavus]
MSPFTVLLIALGVSADAFAVALGKGLTLPRVDRRSVLAIAATFGLFQAVMPLVGWLLGAAFADYIRAVDHWIAFALLAGIGLHMIWAAVRPEHEDDEAPGRLRRRDLTVLGLATSIDALVIGVSLAFMEVDILPTVAVIGVTTFVLSAVGVALGRRIGSRLGPPAEIGGGLILIGLGVTTLLEHLRA